MDGFAWEFHTEHLHVVRFPLAPFKHNIHLRGGEVIFSVSIALRLVCPPVTHGGDAYRPMTPASLK